MSRALAARTRSRRRQRGVAMILVLGALAILTVMLSETQDESSAEFGAALSARDQLSAEYAARSAVNLSRLLIAAEPTMRRQLAPILMLLGAPNMQLPVWEYADQVLGAFNDATGKEAFAALSGLDLSQGEHLGLEGAGFEVQILAEDSKINVNQAARESFSKQRLMQQLMVLMQAPQYDALFSNEDADGQFSDREAICSALIDWPDSDQDLWPCTLSNTATAQQTAPEDSFYERLDRPYMRKNAPYDSLFELYRVRGVSEDFWATFIEPDPDNPRKRVMTVWGQDKINVNSANPQVLLALICQAAEQGTKICDGGEGSMQFLIMVPALQGMAMGAPVFSSPNKFIETLKGGGLLGPILAGIGIEPVKFKPGGESELLKMAGTESKVFSIYAKGFVRVGKRETLSRIHAVVDFRAAPPPGQAQTLAQAEQVRQALEAQQQTAQAAAVEKAIENALKPSPAGNIVYYRMD